MANVYVSSVSYTAVAQWAGLTAYSSTSNGGRGDYVRQLAAPSIANERVFRCTTAGTSLASEPAWTVTKNGVTTEVAGPVWTECTGQEADQVSGTWKAPHSRLVNAQTATWGAAGDTFYVSSDHAETQAATMTIVPPGTSASPCNLLCVTKTTVPPASANLTTGATITTTGATSMSINGFMFSQGVRFSGATSGANTLAVGSANSKLTFLNCILAAMSNSGINLTVGSAVVSVSSEVRLVNTQVDFNAVTSRIRVQICRLQWEATASAIISPAGLTGLFNNAGISGGVILLDGVDLSLLGSGDTIFVASALHYDAFLKDCKLDSAVTVAGVPTALGSGNVYVLRSDSAGNYRSEKYLYEGTLLTETTVIRTGGASDGTTGMSWKVTATANSKFTNPFRAMPVATWNDVTGSNVVVTVEGVQDPRTSTSLPNNDDVWFDVEYLGSASTPLGSFKRGTKADVLAAGAALTASTEAWDSGVTARANSTAYSLGAIRKVASNPGRIFVCTTAGTSAGSEPGGYASAVDGGAVTDNTAVFTAAVRFKQSLTLSSPQPGQKGTLYVHPVVAKASGIYYVDPFITLS